MPSSSLELLSEHVCIGGVQRFYQHASSVIGLPMRFSVYLPIDLARVGIFGHAMGGHGALSLALKHPGLFKSVSAFAPICAPSLCPWGQKAFTGYLGSDASTWAAHDSSALMAAKQSAPYPRGILIDQGRTDKFLPTQLFPEKFEAACQSVGQPLTLRRHAGYDHSYYFVATFMADHLAHHAKCLRDQA